MRVVSLVPSLTEAVAVTLPGVLAGATDWCDHPADLDVARIGGTKNPRIDRIVSLRPDLVIANEEENRAADLDALRAAGVEVLVTEVRTVPGAVAELDRVLTACGAPERPAWLAEAETAWAALPAPAERTTAVVPVWRRPGRSSAGTPSRATSWPASAWTTSTPATPTATRAFRRPSCSPAPPDWSSCPTSPTASPPTTAPRPSPACPARWSADGT